jgi:hypothetical protein
MTLPTRNTSPQGQGLGTPSRNRGRSHLMGLWPALRRSKRRTSGQRTSNRPIAYTACAFCELGWQLRCPSHGTCVFWHYPSSARRAMVDYRAYDSENTGVLALTAQTPTGMQFESPVVNNVACRLSSACPKRTILHAPLLESRQAQPLLTPSAQHWYPFGSIKELNTMQESYKRPNVKRGGLHSQCAPSLTTCGSRRLDAERPLI